MRIVEANHLLTAIRSRVTSTGRGLASTAVLTVNEINTMSKEGDREWDLHRAIAQDTVKKSDVNCILVKNGVKMMPSVLKTIRAKVMRSH